MKKTRLIFAIISTIIEEILIALGVVWGLPKININIPVYILIPVMAVWLYYSIYTYQKGTNALNKGHVSGMSSMIGTRGTVTRLLAPDGWVKIQGELWAATSLSGEIQPGEVVIVTGQKGLKLEVRNELVPEDITAGQQL